MGSFASLALGALGGHKSNGSSFWNLLATPKLRRGKSEEWEGKTGVQTKEDTRSLRYTDRVWTVAGTSDLHKKNKKARSLSHQSTVDSDPGTPTIIKGRLKAIKRFLRRQDPIDNASFSSIDTAEKDSKCSLNNITPSENSSPPISFEFDSMDDIEHHVSCSPACEIINEVSREVSYTDSHSYCDRRESTKSCSEPNEEESAYMRRNSSKKSIREPRRASSKRRREGLSMRRCESNPEEDSGTTVERIIYDIPDESKEETPETSRKVLFYNNSDDLLENRSTETIIAHSDIESETNNRDTSATHACPLKQVSHSVSENVTKPNEKAITDHHKIENADDKTEENKTDSKDKKLFESNFEKVLHVRETSYKPKFDRRLIPNVPRTLSINSALRSPHSVFSKIKRNENNAMCNGHVPSIKQSQIVNNNNQVICDTDIQTVVTESTLTYSLELPPPLPPRPGRGNVVYPNKPLVRPTVRMKALDWNRIILQRPGDEPDRPPTTSTIWHSMLEPKIDNEEVERLFRQQDGTTSNGVSLYSDVIAQRGKTKHQLVTILEREKSGRLAFTMKALPHPLSRLTHAITSLEVSPINTDRFAELMELFGAGSDVDKINAYVKRKGPGNLDHPEYLLYELSKMEHFRERVDFLRFRYRAQWQLFEMDQQLRELHTACDEITNSLSLKNLLETLLAVGNYLNGSSQNGQADGFSINILNKLKEIKDIDDKGNLLEFIMKMYCQFYEVEIDIGCPTRFRLPEPSNMRHAAQVSFDSIHESLASLHAEFRSFQDKTLEKLTKAEPSSSINNFRTVAEHFFSSAQEVMTDADTHLRETKEVFEKTKLYFMYDNPQCPPQDFFQIWAVFLHDCKYYWKLAHRKISKDRFEFEFKYKGQMSVNSAHGYDSFRASMLRRLTTLHRSVPDGPPSGNPNLKPQQPNTWADSVDAKTPQETPDKASLSQKKPDLDITSSSSPKLLTSEPPASLHKPQPLMNGHQEPSHLQGSSNYENHEDVEKMVPGPQQDVPVDPIDERPPMPLPDVGDQKLLDKQGPFSIKTWLKREPGRPQRGNDNKPLCDGRTLETPEQQAKRPSSTTFSKLRSNFVQKITGSSSGHTPKRPSQLSVHQNSEAPDTFCRPLEVSPSFTPLKITTEFDNIDPYMTSLGRDDRQHLDTSSSSIRHYPFTSSADRRTFDHRVPAPRRGRHPGRDGSDVSTEYAGLYHTPPFSTTASVDRDGYASPNVIGPFTKNDINNNEKHNNFEADSDRNRGVPVLSRAPLTHSDHHNISFQSRDNDSVKPNSGSAPSYKSKSNPRQVRLDVSSAMKYQSEMGSQQLTEMTPSDLSHTDLKVPMREHRPPPPVDNSPAQRDTKKESSWRKELSALYSESPTSKSSEEKPVKITLGRAHQRQQKAAQQQQRQYQQQNNLKPVTASVGSNAIKRDVPPQKPPRTPQMQRSHCHMDLSQTTDDPEKPIIPERLRGQQHHAITSLINRFEKNTPSNDATSVNRNLNKTKNFAPSSTPLNENKQIGNNEEDPPPLPPRLDYPYSEGKAQYNSHSNESTLVKTPVNSGGQLDSKQSQSVPNYLHSKFSNRYDVHKSDASNAAVSKPIHSRESTGLSDIDGYTDQLRKAASSSVFDRYKHHKTPNQSDKDSKSNVETARRNLNHVYDKQSGMNSNYSPQSSNTHQPLTSYGSHTPSIQTNTPQHAKLNQNHVTLSPSSYNIQRNQRREEGATAVIKPTVMQGAVMDF